jgi:hypothetical protein
MDVILDRSWGLAQRETCEQGDGQRPCVNGVSCDAARNLWHVSAEEVRSAEGLRGREQALLRKSAECSWCASGSGRCPGEQTGVWSGEGARSHLACCTQRWSGCSGDEGYMYPESQQVRARV